MKVKLRQDLNGCIPVHHFENEHYVHVIDWTQSYKGYQPARGHDAELNMCLFVPYKEDMACVWVNSKDFESISDEKEKMEKSDLERFHDALLAVVNHHFFEYKLKTLDVSHALLSICIQLLFNCGVNKNDIETFLIYDLQNIIKVIKKGKDEE